MKVWSRPYNFPIFVIIFKIMSILVPLHLYPPYSDSLYLGLKDLLDFGLKVCALLAQNITPINQEVLLIHF